MVEGEKNRPILVVDDDPSIVLLMKVSLESEGYRVETASNGCKLNASINDVRLGTTIGGRSSKILKP